MNRLLTWVSLNDVQLLQFVHQQLRCRLLDFTLPKITHLGGATFTLSSLFLIIILSSSPIKLLAFQALLSLTLSHVVVHIIKKIYSRERPYKKLANIVLSSHPLRDYSFPSGHTTAAFSTIVVFALHSFVLAAFLLPLASLIGFSRMYLGLHYPTDCMIGAMLGSISAFTIVYFVPFF
ncbi:phosphatase PAP2 family protein [Halalkalibacter lacteus]|uniref:phosphatase PAP2 family protein n=1 Tax=Halalkalibacter lacteus TaxID=3090663 RepID=UPI002FCA1647